jgi:hypothetical protein
MEQANNHASNKSTKRQREPASTETCAYCASKGFNAKGHNEDVCRKKKRAQHDQKPTSSTKSKDYSKSKDLKKTISSLIDKHIDGSFDCYQCVSTLSATFNKHPIHRVINDSVNLIVDSGCTDHCLGNDGKLLDRYKSIGSGNATIDTANSAAVKIDGIGSV